MVRVMVHITASVEYGLHCLLWLVDADETLSSREMAELQGLSPTFMSKVFGKLEKGGIVDAVGGVRGGYRLARDPAEITFLHVVDAIEGRKPLFDCQQVRGRCAAFGEQPPPWATRGLCSIHAVMLKAEKSMRDTLSAQTLADLAVTVRRKAPPEFANEVTGWMRARTTGTKRAARSNPAPVKRVGR